MWALPDIKRMNEEAVRQFEEDRDKTQKQLCKGQVCEECGWNGKTRKAVHATPWYDVFGDEPKGYLYQCKDHTGTPEGYFYCDACERVMINNYTWELYKHQTAGGEICLNCYFDQEIAKSENWITDVSQVTQEKVFQARHLIPVAGTHWQDSLEFVENTEADSYTGAKITGFSSSSSQADGLADLRRIVSEALKDHHRCILILDGAYQFAVSLGVYVDKK